MPPTPFAASEGGVAVLKELDDVALDSTTLSNGDELVYDATDRKWKNAAGAGGALFAGTTNDYLYKDGAIGRTGGISNDPTASGKAMVVDSTLLRIGIGGSDNAISPANPLEVAGKVRVRGLTTPQHDLVIDNDAVGLATATPLQLFSHNQNASAADRVEVDSSAKQLTVGGTVRNLDPLAFDLPNGTDTAGLYRFKLQQGTYNQATGQQPFQNPPAAALNFPLGVVHPYVNNLPLNTPVFTVGRKTNATYSPGFTGRILAWGINNSTTGFEDQCLYDPCNMRAAWDAGVNAFLGVSTPGAFRASETKGIFRVECWVEGNFAAQNASNRLNVAVWQYRSGVFLRQLLLGISNNAQGQAMSCHRVIMSQGGYGEDFEPTTDHYEVMFENANASTNDFDLTLFQGQIYWYPAL